MGQHRNKVIFRWCIDPLIPQFGKVLQTAEQFLVALLFRVDDAHSGNCSRHI